MDAIACPPLARRMDAASGQAVLNTAFAAGIAPKKHPRRLFWPVLRPRAALNCVSGSSPVAAQAPENLKQEEMQ